MLAAGQIFLSVTNKADLQPEALMKFLLVFHTAEETEHDWRQKL